MGKRRSMMRKKKYDDDDAYNRESIWSNLTHDVLLLVMMKLGFVDFLAFNRVCKSWRSLAVSNRNKFIVSKPPMSLSFSFNDANEEECYLEEFEEKKLKTMSISISTRNKFTVSRPPKSIYISNNTASEKKKYCYLKDFEGRKIKTILPHFAGRECIGGTCGYLILFGKKTSDFWLVNPITRHEIHFPNIPPDDLLYFPPNHRAILVFSPSISGCMFVVFNKYCCNKIWFCIAGKREWTKLPSPLLIQDLIAFKGKIYTVHYFYDSYEVRICEMKLYPDPEFVLLKTESFPKPKFIRPEFVTFGENLYVIDFTSLLQPPYRIHEIDLDKMKLVSREKAGKEYAFFGSDPKYVNSISIYDRRYAGVDKIGKGGSFDAELWYFFFDCLNVDLIHE